MTGNEQMKYINLFIIISIAVSCAANVSTAKVKRSALAGRWYPSGSIELAGQIDALLMGAGDSGGCADPRIVILPHAGYRYSGKTASFGYRHIGKSAHEGTGPDLVVILGPSHYSAFRGCVLSDVDFFETPLGRVRVERVIARKLLKHALFKSDPAAFEPEHSIEIHLPFLQRIFREKMNKGTRVLPVLVGEVDDNEAGRIAGILAAAVAGTRTIFIVSSDFTHYGPNFGYEPFGRAEGHDTAALVQKLDSGAIDLILKKDGAGFAAYVERTGATICGRNPIRIALALPLSGTHAEKIMYDTSAAVTGDYVNSVSYASLLICGRLPGAEGGDKEENGLTRDVRKFLLRTARRNIASWLESGRGARVAPGTILAECRLNRGAFVTLKKGGSLRGCVGYIAATKPLIDTVLDNSYNAAFRDPRFDPLMKDEIGSITIEISVLTEPVPVLSVRDIRTGRDGLIVERGTNRGLLLPQVATEQGWDVMTFVRQTCTKAGLPSGAWNDGVTKIYRFQAIVFSEEDVK